MQKFGSIPAIAAGLLMLVGVTTMSGWLVRNPQAVQVTPGFVAMVFSAAFCFALAGLALLLPVFRIPAASSMQSAIGKLLVAIAAIVLACYVAGTGTPFDFGLLHAWLDDGNPVPGRMAPGTALAFALIGAVLIMMPRVQSKAGGGAIQLATFLLLVLGFVGLAGYALRLELLYHWVPAKRIAIQTSVAILVAGVGLWGQWRRDDWYRSQRFFRDDEKAGYVAATILTVIAMTAGIVGFSVQQATLSRTLGDNMLAQLHNQTALFKTIVYESMADAEMLAARHQLIQLTRSLANTPDNAQDLAQLHAIGRSILAARYNGVALFDDKGRELMRLGRFAENPGVSADMGLPYPVRLLWDGNMLLNVRVPVRDGYLDVGTLMVEQPANVIADQLALTEGFGRTGELGICNRDGEQLACFPQRRNPKVHSIPRVNAEGSLTPMAYASDGLTGLVNAMDYRGQNVIAAYGPLTKTGLGIVIKQDAEELYQPIRQQLNWYIPMLLLLVGGGGMMLRSQVKPLVAKLLWSERHARMREAHIRTVVDNIAEGIITLNEDGTIESFNTAASRIFGYTPEEAVGMPMTAMMPPAMRGLHEAGIQRYLMGGNARFVGMGNRELPALHKNGTVFPLELAVTEMRVDEHRLFVGIVRDITERKRAERALQESEARSREITATLGEGVIVTDREGMVIFSNPAAQKLLGWTEDELLGSRGHMLFHYKHADGTPYPEADCRLRSFVRAGQPFRVHDETFWRKDGSMLPVSINSTPIIRDGDIVGAVVAFHDIIERKRSEQRLAAESAKNATLLRTASDGIHVLDLQGNLVQANDAFCRMLGYPPEAVQGMNISQWDAQWSIEDLLERVRQAQGSDILFETRHRRRDGSVLDVEIHASGVTIDGKQLLYASARDISERKKAAEQVQHLAHYDILTDLPNRALFGDRLKQALAKAKRDKCRMALMFIDLDKFKPVNDTWGHDTGDLLLKAVAVRLKNCLRESDTVARVGGDEFIVLLPQIEDGSYGVLVAEKILAELNMPFKAGGHVLDISASIGVSVYPDDGDTEEALMKSADTAMYHAKERGGCSVIAFSGLHQSSERTVMSD